MKLYLKYGNAFVGKGAILMSIDKYETLNQERKIQNMKKKVAAYCRVSTDNDDQANSFVQKAGLGFESTMSNSLLL